MAGLSTIASGDALNSVFDPGVALGSLLPVNALGCLRGYCL